MLLRGFDPVVFLLAIPGLLMALAFHEWAHAFAADRFGDDTPRRQGRLTLDPRAHLDFFGTLMLVVVGFGWAKPVMVNPSRFRNRFWGDLVVSSAGVIMNVLLAILFVLLFMWAQAGGLFRIRSDELQQALFYAASINMWLAAFNFLPVPPLDGYRVVARLIPGFYGTSVQRFLDQYGMFALMLILFLSPGTLRVVLGPLQSAIEWLVFSSAGLFLGGWG